MEGGGGIKGLGFWAGVLRTQGVHDVGFGLLETLVFVHIFDDVSGGSDDVIREGIFLGFLVVPKRSESIVCLYHLK